MGLMYTLFIGIAPCVTLMAVGFKYLTLPLGRLL